MPITILSDITHTEVKEYFNIPASDTTRDTQIDFIVPLCNKQIIDYCRNDFESKARVSEYPFIDDKFSEFFTKYRPIARGETITLIEDSTTLTLNTDFRINYDTGGIQKIIDTSSVFYTGGGRYWSMEADGVVVSYTGGEALTDDVIKVAYELIGITAGIKTRGYIDNNGVEQVVSINSLPKSLIDILDRHKNYRV